MSENSNAVKGVKCLVIRQRPLAHLEYGGYPLCGQRGKVRVMTEDEMCNAHARCCKKCREVWGNLEVA